MNLYHSYFLLHCLQDTSSAQPANAKFKTKLYLINTKVTLFEFVTKSAKSFTKAHNFRWDYQ